MAATDRYLAGVNVKLRRGILGALSEALINAEKLYTEKVVPYPFIDARGNVVRNPNSEFRSDPNEFPAVESGQGINNLIGNGVVLHPTLPIGEIGLNETPFGPDAFDFEQDDGGEHLAELTATPFNRKGLRSVYIESCQKMRDTFTTEFNK